MRAFLLFVLAIVVVVGGIVGYDQYQKQMLAGKITTETATIMNGYDALIEKNITPLAAEATFTQKQNAAVNAMKEIQKRFGSASIADRASLIHDMQTNINAFLSDVQPTQAFASGPEVATLQREMGKNSSLRDTLNAYNAIAKQWNDRASTLLADIDAYLPVQPADILPYLRFDGQQEFLTTVHL